MTANRQNLKEDALRRDPYQFTIHEPTVSSEKRVTWLDCLIALALGGFAGLIGLLLGPLLALAMLAGEFIPGWNSPDNEFRVWVVALSFLFSPLLAVLAFRGHLQAVREGHQSKRTPAN